MSNLEVYNSFKGMPIPPLGELTLHDRFIAQIEWRVKTGQPREIQMARFMLTQLWGLLSLDSVTYGVETDPVPNPYYHDRRGVEAIGRRLGLPFDPAISVTKDFATTMRWDDYPGDANSGIVCGGIAHLEKDGFIEGDQVDVRVTITRRVAP